MRVVLAIACLLATGCSGLGPFLSKAGTPADEQIGGGIHRIAVPKGGLADCASAEDCVLVKAAESAQRVGGTHFVVLPGYDGSAQVGYAYVRVFSLSAGERTPTGAASVEEVLQFIRKQQRHTGVDGRAEGLTRCDLPISSGHA